MTSTQSKLSGFDDSPGQTEFNLNGLRAIDPLGFLATLGTLRFCEEIDELKSPRIAWNDDQSYWIPRLTVEEPITKSRFITLLHNQLIQDKDAPRYSMTASDERKDKLQGRSAQQFRELIQHVPVGTEDEYALASYATDAFANTDSIGEFRTHTEETALTRLDLADVGSQGFIKTQRKLQSEVNRSRSKLTRTLFKRRKEPNDAVESDGRQSWGVHRA